jgi:beta-glucosidase
LKVEKDKINLGENIMLNPGQAENLSFTLTPDDLTFIGVDLKRIV